MAIEATRLKLREAHFFYQHLIDQQQRRMPEQAFGFYFSPFISAARSVSFLQNEQQEKYLAWEPGWKEKLNAVPRNAVF